MLTGIAKLNPSKTAPSIMKNSLLETAESDCRSERIRCPFITSLVFLIIGIIGIIVYIITSLLLIPMQQGRKKEQK
jgi:hypothetical protein